MDDTFHPWLKIWTNPRATIRRIVTENPNRSLWLLAAIQGFCSLLNKEQTFELGRHWNLLTIFCIAIILSPFWGYLVFSVWSAVVYWTGKLFKGAASFQAVRAAYAWACVPVAIKIFLWILLISLFGLDLFISPLSGEETRDSLTLVLFLILAARLVATVWSLVIYFNALAEVQGYSILKAIANALIAGFCFAAFAIVISYLFIPLRQG